MDNVRVKIYPTFIRVFFADSLCYGKSSLDDIPTSFSSFDISDDDKRKHSISVSRSRTIRKVFDYSACNDFSYFLTMTFNPQLVDSFNYDECVKKMSNWLKNFRITKASFSYIGVPEKHKSGRFHFHFLVSSEIAPYLIDSGHKDRGGHTVYNILGFKWGFTTAIEIYETGGRLASYLSKYITKDLCNSEFGKKRYWHSTDLQLPKQFDTTFTYDDFCSLDEPYYRKIVSNCMNKIIIADFDKNPYNSYYINQIEGSF